MTLIIIQKSPRDLRPNKKRRLETEKIYCRSNLNNSMTVKVIRKPTKEKKIVKKKKKKEIDHKGDRKRDDRTIVRKR